MDIGTEVSYELLPATSPEDWAALHELRRSQLFERKLGVIYNANHPHDRAPGHFPMVFKLRGETIGTARLDLFGSGRGVMRLVAVAKAEQDRGHGRILWQKFKEFARGHGVNKLFVNANPTAVGYYEKIGFIREFWGDPDGPRTGVAKKCIQMTKVI
jgi:N-acetylglutamate synthase-like GNAT family acetyltransferase